MSSPAAQQAQTLMRAGEQGVWALVALALALDGRGADAAVTDAAAHVARAAGVDLGAGLGELAPDKVAAQAAAPVLQAARVLQADVAGWADQPDAALLAQGRASAQAAPMFLQFAMPSMAGLADALGRPGARMLDVGTGVGALAIAYAEALPELTVVGLDVMPRVLALAEQNVAASSVAHRVELRLQDVADLDEVDAYDLAWLPAPFVPEAALTRGLSAMARALRPGGWLMIGHGKFAGDPLDDAITRFKTVIFGGTALDDAQAADALSAVGLVDVRSLPTPPGAPAITIGRRAG